jgi:anti-sigma regulatory factor (Ser/Thr protein kinase)
VDSTVPDSPPRAATALRSGGALDAAGYGHAAAVVGSDAEILASALPFLEAGLRAGDLVALSCPPDMTALLCEALGEQAELVENDPGLTLLGARAPDAIGQVRTVLQRAASTGSGRLRMVVGIDWGSEPADWREGQRFESVYNRLMRSAPAAAICLYDRRRLPARVVESAAATHPLLVSGARWTVNTDFQDPGDYVPSLPLPREPMEQAPPVFVLDDARSLATMRHALGAVLVERVPDSDQREDLHLALAEIAANAFRHGARPVNARVWADRSRIVCTITDAGTSYGDPFAGFIPAHGYDLSQGGMGLWLARKLWDHVDLLPGPRGLTVRLSTSLRRPVNA